MRKSPGSNASSFIIICAWCQEPQNEPRKTSRSKNGKLKHASSQISHTICPECSAKELNYFQLQMDQTISSVAHK